MDEPPSRARLLAGGGPSAVPQATARLMTTLLGHDVTITLDLDGEPFDITRLLVIDSEAVGGGIHIPARDLILAVQVERGIRLDRKIRQVLDVFDNDERTYCL